MTENIETKCWYQLIVSETLFFRTFYSFIGEQVDDFWTVLQRVKNWMSLSGATVNQAVNHICEGCGLSCSFWELFRLQIIFTFSLNHSFACYITLPVDCLPDDAGFSLKRFDNKNWLGLKSGKALFSNLYRNFPFHHLLHNSSTFPNYVK